MTAALELIGIRKTFDGFVALSEAGLCVQWGEVHALLGENGAGKSSLMNVAAGLYAPEAGDVLVDAQRVRLDGPAAATHHGIGMVHQHFKLVRSFTVAENVLLSSPPPPPGTRARFGARRAAVADAIRRRAAELGFEIDPGRRVEDLSVAEQQRVEILKVLLAGARILILDEPTAVLTDAEAGRLLDTVRGFARRGGAVVLVTHKMADVREFADRVTVMRGGRSVGTVDPRAVSSQELVRLTVGDAVATPLRTQRTRGAPTLVIRALSGGTGHRPLAGVDLTVHGGEIYGLAGVGGNGQGELADAIVGLAGAMHGEIRVEGAGDLREASPSQRRSLGIAAIPADRYAHALSGALSVAENFGLGQVHEGRYGPAWKLDRAALARDTAAAVAGFDVQGVRSVHQKAALLSGGNAQKLVIAREFSKSPQLVLAHSPSRGLDVRAAAQVHARLLAARDAGAAVLLISEDLDEVLALSDRIGVMTRGRVVAEFAQPADRQAIGAAMVSHA